MGLSKTQLIDAVAKATELKKKDVDLCVKTAFDLIEAELKKGESVNLVGFGTFSVTERAARQGINPRTKEKIEIPAKRSAKFKAGKPLIEAVNAAK